MPRVFWLAALIVLLLGCVQSVEVQERMAFWEAEASQFFSYERTIDELHPWLRQRDVYYTFDDNEIVDGNWMVGLEKINTESFNCEWIDIQLHVTVTENGQIGGYRLEDDGPCLL